MASSERPDRQKIDSRHHARNVGASVGSVIALGAGLAHFGILPPEHHIGTALHLPDKNVAREAVAHRFEACEVTSFVDTRTRDAEDRGKLLLTLALKKNPKAGKYLKAYKRDDTVVFGHPITRALPARRDMNNQKGGEFQPGGSQMVGGDDLTIQEAGTGYATFSPATDIDPVGLKVGLFVEASASTTGDATHSSGTAQSVVDTACATIQLTQDEHGDRVWKLLPTDERYDDIYFPPFANDGMPPAN